MKLGHVIILIAAIELALSCSAVPPTPMPTPTPESTPTSRLTPTPAQSDKDKTMPAPPQTRVIFFGNPRADPVDRLTMGEVCKELGFSFETRDYRLVNDETKWFDANGQRRFHIIIFPGGHSEKWFEKEVGSGINERGCQNIKKFISNGGSCWAICYSGNSVFAERAEFVGFMGTNQTVQVPGRMVKYCGGIPIFKGKVVGPQKSNRPYPRVRFLPIKLNMENPIVKEAKLPEKIYLSTVASPSLIPNRGQSMEVIGWFPNGDAAIAIVKYGEGHLYMVTPHVSQSLEIILDGEANYIRRWEAIEYYKQMGVSKRKFDECKQVLITEGDPDGSGPDRILANALLSDAANRASSLPR